MLLYPKKTIWKNRNNLPIPHGWVTNYYNSFSLKESWMLSIIVVFTTIFIFILKKYPKYKTKLIKRTIIFWIVFLLHPLTSLMALNLIVTSLVRTPPIYLDKNIYFPQASYLEQYNVFNKIKNEISNLVKKPKNIPFTDSSTLVNNKYTTSDKQLDSGWRSFFIKTANTISSKAKKELPYLSSILENMDNVPNALVSVLEGKHCIPIHHGYYKGYLRYHLGIIIPEPDKTVLHVNGIKYHWNEGEGVIFDDMFPHEVYNSSKYTRVILYLDIVRNFPNSKILTNLNKYYCNILSKSPIVKYIQSLDEKRN